MKRKKTPGMGSRRCRRASMLLSGGTRYEVQEMNDNDQHRLKVVYPKSTVCQYLNSRKGVRSIEIKKESGSQQLTIASQSDCSAARPLSDTHCILYFRECQYKKSEQLSHGGPEGSCSCILHGKNHMLATTAAQNASVTAKTPHRGVSSRCVQLPSLADRQNVEKPP